MNYFFDVGANIGQTFYWYLDKTNEYDGWNVFCFEPSPRNQHQLIDTIQKYKFRYNILLCPFGLAGETGLSEFYLKTDPAGDSYNKEWVINDQFQVQVLSPKIDVVWFIKEYTTKDDKIVMKLDCEGSEYGILERLLDNRDYFDRIPKIMVEWHGEEERKQNIINRFKDMGKPLEEWKF